MPDGESGLVHVHFTYPPFHPEPWEGDELVQRMHDMLAMREGEHRYRAVDRYEDADLIVILEPIAPKDASYIDMLREQPAMRERPEACFVYSYEDRPVPLLDGVYVSMPRDWMDEAHFEPWCYMRWPNPHVKAAAERRDHEPRLLFSFRGAGSHVVRRDIFEASAQWGDEAAITRTDLGFNYDEAQRNSYLDEMLDSRFVLCPRGTATTSYRLYETMRLGRVPVILADDWIAPRGPDWQKCAVRVREDQCDQLPTILADHADSWREMATAARAEWEHWFASDRRVPHLLDRILDVRGRRPAGPAPMLRRLEFFRFRCETIGRGQTMQRNADT